MRKLLFPLFLLPLLLVAAQSCGEKEKNRVEAAVSEETKAADIERQLWEKADSALAAMTLEQRIGQCFIPVLPYRSLETNLNLLKKYCGDLHVGGILLHEGDLMTAALLAGESSKTPVPLFVAIDAEWGLSMRLTDAPRFPKNGEIADTTDETIVFAYGKEIARQCRRLGINMVLGPVVDVVSQSGGIIGRRSFGSNPERVAALGRAYALGLESGGVISVAKHFPGHGSSMIDTHRQTAVIDRTYAGLDSIDLYPFKGYVDSGLSAIMVGHLSVPAVDSILRPAAMSPVVIKDLLRDQMGFKGLILTDAMNMGGAKGYDSTDALAAGADMVIAPANIEKEIQLTLGKVLDGEIKEEEINDKCRRILFFKYSIGLDNQPPVSLENIREEISGDSEEIGRKLK